MARKLRTLIACVALTLGLGAQWSVQASEVVKLARLVVTGKRSVETAKAPIEPRSGSETPSHGAGGGGDDHGTAPTPPRNVS